MNKNQVIKGLKRNASAYDNLEVFFSALQSIAELKLSLVQVDNLDAMAKGFDAATKEVGKPICFPFDGVFIDIAGCQMPSMLTGEVGIENIGLHLCPIEFVLKPGVALNCLMVNDFRKYGKDIIYRSYLCFMDGAGLHVMCSVDAMSKGCDCHLKNVFWMNPKFRLQIESNWPGYKNHVGVTMPDCSATKRSCQQTIAQKSEITKLIKIILGYMMVPNHYIVKVTDQSRKTSVEYFAIMDHKQIEMAHGGEPISSSPPFDGTRLFDAITAKTPAQPPIVWRFKSRDNEFEVLPKEEGSK